MKIGAQTVGVDLFDALTHGVVAVEHVFLGELGYTVVAVVGERAEGGTGRGVAIGLLAAGVAAALIQPVAACRRIDIGQDAGVAGFGLAVAVFHKCVNARPDTGIFLTLEFF